MINKTKLFSLIQFDLIQFDKDFDYIFGIDVAVKDNQFTSIFFISGCLKNVNLLI